jgi:hypothetical protein
MNANLAIKVILTLRTWRKNMMTDTIAAIATAVSNAGISIIRISGSDAFHIIDKIYRPRSGNNFLVTTIPPWQSISITSSFV